MRLPDFIIIGTMKSGTTSLFRWLCDQSEVGEPSQKEPGFFSQEDRWSLGIEWYSSLFPDQRLTGEASANYTDPALANAAAWRIAECVPAVRLVCVVRNPVDRLRSHYRHELQRGRERRSFTAATEDASCDDVQRSLYFTCLEPYIRRFDAEQICVVRMEDLGPESVSGWSAVLRHLGLDDRAMPSSVHNVTGDKRQYGWLVNRMWDSGRTEWMTFGPKAFRRIGKKLLTHRSSGFENRLAESVDSKIPEHLRATIWADVERLESWLGVDDHLWPREP